MGINLLADRPDSKKIFFSIPTATVLTLLECSPPCRTVIYSYNPVPPSPPCALVLVTCDYMLSIT